MTVLIQACSASELCLVPQLTLVSIGVFLDGQNYTDGLGGVDCISALNSETVHLRVTISC